MNVKLRKTILKIITTCIVAILFILYAKKLLSTLLFVAVIAITFIVFEIVKKRIDKHEAN